MDRLARRKHILANRLSVALVTEQGAQTVSSQRQQTHNVFRTRLF